MFKKVCLITFVACVVGIVLFYQAIESSILKWMIQNYSARYFETPLQFKKFILHKNQIVLLELHTEDDQFSADKMVLDYNLDLWNRQVNFFITLDQPNYRLKEKQDNQLSRLRSWTEKTTWINLQANLKINQGALIWNSSQLTDQMQFDLAFNQKDGGYVKAYFQGSEKNNNYLILESVNHSNFMQINLQCHEIEATSLFSLAKTVWKGLNHWQVCSGILDGKIEAIFVPYSRPYLTGDLYIDQLAFTDITANLKGNIQRAWLHLEKNSHSNTEEDVLTTVGHVEFLKPAHLNYQSKQIDSWSINHILGRISIDSLKKMVVDLKANGLYQQEQCDFNLTGEANLNSQRHLNFNLDLFCRSPSQQEGHVYFFLDELSQDPKKIEIKLTNLSHIEFGFIQRILSMYWPKLSNIELKSGIFQATLEAHLIKKNLENIQLNHLQVDDLKFKFSNFNAEFSLKHAKGNGSIQPLVPEIWRTINTELHIDNGNIQLLGLDQVPSLTSIQTHLKVVKGLIPHALASLQFAGLQGDMDIEWGEKENLIKIKLNGEMQDLANFFPQHLKQGIHNPLSHHQLAIVADIKKQASNVDLTGIANIWQKNPENAQLIHFGGELKKIADYPERKFAPLGWFYAHNVNLEEYVAPFIFKPASVEVRGNAEFKGSIDQEFLTINYDIDQLVIENENLLIESKQLHSSVPGKLLGFHELNFRSLHHRGMLPVRYATYLDKNTGLHFDNIQGKVLFKNQTIHIHSLEGECQDIQFAGSLALDYEDPAPEVFSLKIHCPTFSGKISQIQHVLEMLHISSPITKMRIDGELIGKGEGLFLKFQFFPNDYHLFARANGALLDGYFPFEKENLSLKGLYADVDYLHSESCLTFSDIQGTLLIGRPKVVQECDLNGHHLFLKNLNKPYIDIDLDICVKKEQDELARLVAITRETIGGGKQIVINSDLSHLSHIYPEKFQCEFSSEGHLSSFEFASRFKIHPLIKNLCLFKKSGLFFLPASFIAKIDQLEPVEGVADFSWHYDKSENSFSYQLESHSIHSISRPVHKAFLAGKLANRRWTIDQIQWDNIHLSVDFLQLDDRWKINFFGLNDSESTVLGLEGEFIPDKGLLNLQVNLLELNLERIEQWSICKNFAINWNPRGQLQLKGKLKFDLLSESYCHSMTGYLKGTAKALSVRNCSFEINRPIQIDFLEENEILIRELPINLNRQFRQLAECNFKMLYFNPIKKDWACEQCDFLFPSQTLKELSAILYRHFPDFIEENSLELLSNCKQEGNLVGNCAFKMSPFHQKFQMNLENGAYFLNSQLYDLKNTQFIIDNNLLTFSADTHQERCAFQIKGTAVWPKLNQGECFFVDEKVSCFPLKISWNRNKKKEFHIQKIKGHFCGLDVNLVEVCEDSSSQWFALKGTIGLNFNLIGPLLTYDLSKKIQKLMLGPQYKMVGHYWLNKKGGPSLLESFYFQGKLTADEAILKGFIFKQVEALINYQPKKLEISQFRIEDPAGIFQCSKLTVFQNKNKVWQFCLPQLSVKNFKPALLKEEVQTVTLAHKFKSLLVKRLDLEGFQGYLGDVSTWQGEGRFHFLNSSPKNVVHTPLLAIPAEIILRLGLDPQVLNPVNGTIFFKMYGDRFYLTRLKDVYSEGRGSKFYLVNHESPSWIDLDGQLSISIRMKQYNLIFKIAELFTVSVQGNLKKPTYSLQKQAKNSRKGAAALFGK
ncbi:Uncharacterized protein PRO82_001716 [Candidatus Protochlamydia amoebophila]|uniref:hypothetical protein n=1 Tax=Candidatus Protochlamydia amoebophila TaxID=362787 RepID=UPI001BC9D6CB|nr:hypothetical protein [Candidatus Protochlamydia amoebophila]MBS4164388.1 Uncharacterized protein [Candidatus Protochlamydia amoebophila]